MDIEVRPCASVEELRQAVDVISHYFGSETTLEDAERFATWLEVERMHIALDGDRIVGGAGAFSYEMSMPGGASVPAAGVTVVGVLPTHRRRGVLSAMMRRSSRTAARAAMRSRICGRRRRRSTAASATGSRRGWARSTWRASGRSSRCRSSRAARCASSTSRSRRARSRRSTRRCVAQRPGMFKRSKAWWETRRLFDDPARRQGGPKNRVLLELDGKPAGYAIYTVKQDWQSGSSKGTVSIMEVVAPTPEASRELWRWLLDFDWTSQFEANLLPVDHELFLLLAEPRRMQFAINDGVWVRPVDVGAALSARSYSGDGEIVLEVDGRAAAGERRPLARDRGRCGAHGGGSRPAPGRRRASARSTWAASASPTSCELRGRRS